MNFNCIKRCECKSLLLVEYDDIKVEVIINKDSLKYYFNYSCPICNRKNYLIEKELPIDLIKEKLVNLRRIYDKI